MDSGGEEGDGASPSRRRRLVKRYSTLLKGEREEAAVEKDAPTAGNDKDGTGDLQKGAAVRFCASSIASVVAETITLPTDVAKVRLQVQSKATLGGNGGGAGTNRPYTGMYDCITRMAKEEGVAACWKGLAPALIRQTCYTSFALVLYEPMRNFMSAASDDDGPPTFLQRLVAGGTSGAISIAVFNWSEVLKTQIQTSTKGTSMRSVAMRVYSTDGILGFWAGVRPNVARTFLVNAAELGTYDQAKTMLIPVVGDNPLAHIGASGIAGFASACTSTPADVVKTRLMNYAGGTTPNPYNGMLDAGSKILMNEGIAALYKGFIPIVARKVIWCTSFFVTYEYIRGILFDKDQCAA